MYGGHNAVYVFRRFFFSLSFGCSFFFFFFRVYFPMLRQLCSAHTPKNPNEKIKKINKKKVKTRKVYDSQRKMKKENTQLQPVHIKKKSFDECITSVNSRLNIQHCLSWKATTTTAAIEQEPYILSLVYLCTHTQSAASPSPVKHSVYAKVAPKRQMATRRIYDYNDQKKQFLPDLNCVSYRLQKE